MAPQILTERRGKSFWIIFNRPEKRNAFNHEMLGAMVQALAEADQDEEVTITVLTGTGDYYSAGYDVSPVELQTTLKETSLDQPAQYKIWVDRLIRHSKPLVALVNGPALGLACTSLALFDAVIASDRAYFYCPSIQMALCPESASTLTFVQTMGYQKAARMALFSEKMTAHEANMVGFVSKVVRQDEYKKECSKLIAHYSKLNAKSLQTTKRLLRPDAVIEELMTVNQREFEALAKLLVEPETLALLLERFGRPKL